MNLASGNKVRILMVKKHMQTAKLYTDWLLQQIYNYGKDKLNLQAMVYFSDQGEKFRTNRITLIHLILL